MKFHNSVSPYKVPFTNSTTYKNVKHECIQFVTTDAFEAYMYARNTLKQPWSAVGKPEAEDVIGKDARWAYAYALFILKCRWANVGKPEVEDLIKHSMHWKYYKRHFNI